MPDTRTPGEICYEVYYTALCPFPVHCLGLTWQATPYAQQRAWEAAAQAVLAAALAARVWARQAPSLRWQVVPQTEEKTP
jgi:hypothetical protein